MDLIIEELVLGAWQANCYVLGDRDSGRAVVVDPGQGGAEPVERVLTRHGLRCEALLLTHGHVDHVWAVPELSADLDAPAYLHPGDTWLWRNPAAAFGEHLPVETLVRQFGLEWEPSHVPLEELADGMRLRPAGLDLEVRHAPGHTPGSCAFLLRGARALVAVPAAQATANSEAAAVAPEEEGVDLLLSGDLLFAGSVGRTDLARGSTTDLLTSIERRVLDLSDATVVAPGHGPRTTVGHERRTNPFLRDIVGGS